MTQSSSRTITGALLVLVACQTLLFLTNATLISVTGLVGLALAPSSSLATIPVTAYVLGAAVATTPVALLMKRAGRRVGFTVGATFGIFSAVVCVYATHEHRFWLLCLGTLIGGVYNACGQLYRFAATEVVPAGAKERAISFVLGGGLIGGVLGPSLSKRSISWFDVPFVGAYAALIGFAALAIVLIQFIQFNPPAPDEVSAEGRPLADIVSQPIFIVAALSAMVSYGVMNLLMTATPIAMQMCNHGYSDSATVLQWHVVGMFLPSFFTGSLIKRFGLYPVMISGAVAMLVCAAVALSGVQVMHFLLGLAALGVGWNFLFIGATTLLTRAYRPSERNKTQGANELLVFATTSTSSFASGVLVTTNGWHALNLAAIPFLLIAIGAILWLARLAPATATREGA